MPRESKISRNANYIMWAILVVPAIGKMMMPDLMDSTLALGVIAIAGIYFFNENFINKAEVRSMEEPDVGPREDFIPPSAHQWETDIDRQSGEIITRKTFRAPMSNQGAR